MTAAGNIPRSEEAHLASPFPGTLTRRRMRTTFTLTSRHFFKSVFELLEENAERALRPKTLGQRRQVLLARAAGQFSLRWLFALFYHSHSSSKFDCVNQLRRRHMNTARPCDVGVEG